MPAQPQDQILSKDNQSTSGKGSNGIKTLDISSTKSERSSMPDPYATLRSDETSDPGSSTMTESKRLELESTKSGSTTLDQSPTDTILGGPSTEESSNTIGSSISQSPTINESGSNKTNLPIDAIKSSDDTMKKLDPVAEYVAAAKKAFKSSDPLATTGIASTQASDNSDKNDFDITKQNLQTNATNGDADQTDSDPAADPMNGVSVGSKILVDKNDHEPKQTDTDNAKLSASDVNSSVATVSSDKDDDQKTDVDVNNVKGGLGVNLSGVTTLSDVLVEMEVIDKEKADEVKLAEVKSGNPQEDILRSQNIADDVQIAKAKAKLYNVEFIDLSKTPVDPEALNLLPQQVAERFKVFPVSVDEASRRVILAMADPLDLTAVEFVEQRAGMTVDVKAADPVEIENMITAGYTTSLAKEVSAALKDVSSERGKVRTLDASRTGLIREEKVAEVVTHILGFAVKSRASDVHIEPQERSTRVRYRIDGILQEKLTIPRELHDALVSRIKILSGMKIDEKRVPQDGRFNFRSEVEEVDLRVSTLPTTWGEKIVMRLLKKSGGIPELPELGLRGRALKNLQESILRPHGIVLITGPTGSGKTTTLYSIIQKINTPKVNIMTLEDPVEYKMHGVNQVQVNPTAGLTFASGMRSFLRQDPNVILVGEIRDQETADLAVQASLTGHLVFSTLHTNSSAGAPPRLLDMGAEPYLLASSITAIVGQRVARKIHDECKTSYPPEPKIIEQIKEELGNLWQPKGDEIKFYKGAGCQACGMSGYLGRVGVFEVLSVSEKIGRLILEQSPSGDIDKQAREEGMITMKQDGFLKVVEGITTIEEVLRVAQE